MQETARIQFNKSFSNEKYQELLSEIEVEFPSQLDFRVAESPVFIDRKLKSKFLMAANGIIDSIKKADFKVKTDKAVPAAYHFENESDHPHFLALDFAISKDEDGDLEPQLIELQGFPSLFGYQNYLSGKYKKHFDVSAKFSPYFNKLNAFTYINEVEKVLKPKSGETTILLEAYPEQQKTRLDFAISKAYWGIDVVCLSQVFVKDRSLYYTKDSQEIKIDRVYNRIIFDELDKTYPELKKQVALLKEAQFEWISHPNWFYRISKFCMPLLKGKYVPACLYLDALTAYPEDLEHYVLKPLFSFAGAGVNLHPTKTILDQISDKENYILQKKVAYEPVVSDTEGKKIKAEIRLLYVWPDEKAHPKLLINLARLSRGEMIGVDYNKNFDWVGGSSAFFETE
ncbi:MAG: hypothetical protein ACI9DJ_002055 [Algoriphagus sp.]|jgi:hypothetical protein